MDFSTGNGTGVWLEVTGGRFNRDSHATQYSGSPDEGDAYHVFNGRLDALGSISYDNQPSPTGDLVLTFSGLDGDKRYNLFFYGHRDEYDWDRASLVTISGADDFTFTNQSSAGAPISGQNNESTRLPADNDNGYVARFTNIDPGSSGEIVLTLSPDGTDGNRGKYANAVMLQERP